MNVWLPLIYPLLGTWPTTQACALTGNRTSDPLLHKPVLNPLSHTSQGYIKVFRRKHMLSCRWGGSYEVLLTTYMPIKIKINFPWIYARHAKINLGLLSQDSWERVCTGDLKLGFPEPPNRWHHDVDNFSQDHRSKNLFFMYYPSLKKTYM